MLIYYFNLALRSFNRNKALTVLMVIAIALGIGASMTTLTVYRVLSGDPIPNKSGKLFYPQIEPRTLGKDGKLLPEPMEQMTRFDAEELLRQKHGDRQAVMTGGGFVLLPEAKNARSAMVNARYTSADFFPMFNPPMLAGRSWTTEEDEAHARVTVISRAMAEKLYDDAKDAVGRTVHLPEGTLQIIGVMDTWKLNPRFYDVTGGRTYGSEEQFYLPFSTAMELHMDTQGSMNCWGNFEDSAYGLSTPCAWLQYWVELDTPAKAADYKKYLLDYSEQQRRAGRFERPANTRLYNVMQWLDHNRIVPNDVRLQMWLAFGFLLVCLLNTTGLLLAKFLRRGGEIGVRRALGASKRDIFSQCLVEVACIGIAGAALGAGMAALGLWLVRQQPDSYAKLAQMDVTMLLMTFVLALAASLLSGLFPAWQAMRIAPSVQLKTQ
jgi:putative ABC transport system permease protein